MSDDWTSHESVPAAWPRARSGTLAALPRQHRPREKAFAKGVSALGQAELLALLLGNGTAKVSVFFTTSRGLSLPRYAGSIPSARIAAPKSGTSKSVALASTRSGR